MEDLTKYEVISTLEEGGNSSTLFEGPYDSCVQTLREFVLAGRNPATLDIRNVETGRLMSWVL